MPGNADDSGATEITFHNIKSTQFRVVHVDGAVIGVTPSLQLHCALFNERGAIAQQETYSVGADGALGARTKQITRGGIVREIEVDALMTVETARSVRDLLSAKIAEIETALTKMGGPPPKGVLNG